MESNLDVGNYHFFYKDDNYFIYDVDNNILYSPNNKKDFREAFEVLQKVEKGVTGIQNEAKYSALIDCFNTNFRTFNSSEYLNIENTVSSKITLMISQDCNLKCKYCYGDEGRFGSNKEMMTKGTAKKVIDYFVGRGETYGLKHFFITFLGGEPLMNFPLLRFVVEYVKEEYPHVDFAYTITTNLTILTVEIADYFRNNNISVLVSLDGKKRVHDKNRIYKNGKGSFDDVIRKIELLKQRGVPFSVRATLSHEDFTSYEENIEFFQQIKAQQIYVSRLINYDVNTDKFDINVDELEKDVATVEAFHDKTHLDILKGKNPAYVPYVKMFQKLHEANDSLISCGIMKGSTAVSFDGRFYPCHRFVGIKGFEFGNIERGIDAKVIKNISDELDLKTKKCNKCWARYMCKRGCVRDIAKNNGRFIEYDQKFCELTKKSIEKALLAYFSIITNRPNYMNNLSLREGVPVYNVV